MRISVVTAVFNRADQIGDALDAVAAQRDVDCEHVVIDGASTDGTLALLQGAAERGAISTLLSEPDAGIYDALNKGVDRASGDVIGFLHSDDRFADDRVLASVAEAFAAPEVDVVYGDLDYVSKERPDRVIRHWKAGPFDRARLKAGWMPPHPTLFLRRRVYERVGGFNLSYRIAADYDHVLRVFSDRALVARYVPRVLVKMRVGGASNRSLANILRKSQEDWRAASAAGLPATQVVAAKNVSKISQFWRRDRRGGAREEAS